MFSIDPVTAVLSLVLFCAFTVPFIYHYQKNKRREKLLLQRLKETASQSGAIPDVAETWRYHYAIGLDKTKKRLIYVMEDENSYTICLPLSDVKKVSLIKKNREIETSEGKKTILEQVVLELHHDSSKKPSLLEFYNEKRFSDLMGEAVLAENWAELIRQNL
jgi:hypothetical protein